MDQDTLKFIRSKVEHHSKLLNLDAQGWKISVECDCIEAISNDKLSMSIKFNPNTKVAVLNLKQEETMVQSESLEEGVIHELLHLKFWFVQWEDEDVIKNVLLENAINEIAAILTHNYKEVTKCLISKK